MSRKRNRHAPRKPAPAAPQAAVDAHEPPPADDAIHAQAATDLASAEGGQAGADALEASGEGAAQAAADRDSVTPEDGEARHEFAAPPVRRRAPDTRAPFAILLDYEDRSLRHAAGLPEQIDAPGLWRGVGYRVGSRRLASGFDEVVEILPMPQVTHVPGAQPWMLGVANVRGNLLPIVDLKQFLEGERTVLHEGQRMLVVRQSGGDVAITVDELYGQRSFVEEQRIDVDSAEARPGVALAEGRYAHLIERSYRIDTTTWGVLSLDRLSRTPEFRQAAA